MGRYEALAANVAPPMVNPRSIGVAVAQSNMMTSGLPSRIWFQFPAIYLHPDYQVRIRIVCDNGAVQSHAHDDQPAYEMPVAKTCSTCWKRKWLHEFSPHPRTLDGRQSRCKDCCAAVLRGDREEHPEAIAETKRKYNEKGFGVNDAHKRRARILSLPYEVVLIRDV